MSGGAVFGRALRIVREKSLPAAAERDLLAALEAGRSGPLAFAWLAGTDAGLEREALLQRAAAVFFNFAAANLADDLADGDCTWLDERAAPGVQFVLQNLFFETLARAGFTAEALAEISAELVAAAAPHSLEVRAERWSLDLARQVAEGLAGGQYAAYLRILWSGTPLAARARRIGHDLGIAGHVAADLASRDPRAFSLDPGERGALIEWAWSATARLRGERLGCLDAALRTLEPILAPARSAAPAATGEEVIAYYEAKTGPVLRKFGPGPRVHYHTGEFAGPVSPEWTLDELRARLAAAQEALLERAARGWCAAERLGGEVLDAGCGLGGGALFWAQRYGARVTAVTNVPGHVPLVRSFAAGAGVADRVEPLLCEATRVPGEARFDAAVALESSCYFDRAAWFECLARVLRPGAPVFVLDCFLGRPEVAGFFDGHWRTRIGTLEEYESAARATGFRLAEVVTLNPHTAGFWQLTLAWARREAGESSGGTDAAALERSLRAHERLHQAYLDEGVRHLQLCFERG